MEAKVLAAERERAETATALARLEAEIALLESRENLTPSQSAVIAVARADSATRRLALADVDAALAAARAFLEGRP